MNELPSNKHLHLRFPSKHSQGPADPTMDNQSSKSVALILAVLVPILFIDQVVPVCHVWPVPKLWCTRRPKCSRETPTINSCLFHPFS